MDTNAALHERRLKAIPLGVASSASDVYVSTAQGAVLYDVEGKTYFDFAGGVGVQAVGHCHPVVVEKIIEQIGRFMHTAFPAVPYESYVSLAERLNKIAPMPDTKTLLVTTGAEAVENAVKIARIYTQRKGIIAFDGAFHGRTELGMKLTGNPKYTTFGVDSNNVYHVPFPMLYRGVREETAIQTLEKTLKDKGANTIAAIIIEPVQGEGGFHVASPSFMKKLRAICDEHGILLICDEIQSGFGRTGKMFATEHSGIHPDMITVAKALGGGLPLAGVIGKKKIMDKPLPGQLGTGTYGGNPVSCAAAHGVLDVIEKENLCERSREIGEKIRARLSEIRLKIGGLPDAYSIDNIRGLGAMMAFDLKGKNDNKPPSQSVSALLAAARDQGLIMLSCGTHGESIRLLPPLTITDRELDQALDILEKCLEKGPVKQTELPDPKAVRGRDALQVEPVSKRRTIG